MGIDWDAIAAAGGIPKSSASKDRQARKSRNEAAWRKTKATVDERHKGADGAPVCWITGRRLQNVDETKEETFRDRAHVEPRSKSKSRRFDDPDNVFPCSRKVHRAIDGSRLLLFDKTGRKARRFSEIDHVAWNRRLVARGEEPFSIRPGLPVVELEQVRD